MVNLPSRLEAILSELQRDSDDYIVAKQSFDVARVHFEAARDRLAATKALAADMMDFMDWYRWRTSHPNVKFAAGPMGEAITEVLNDCAVEEAFAFARGRKPKFDPFLALEQITLHLEAGGFSFRTSTPAREVNAALINLDVLKAGRKYAAKDKDDTMLFAQNAIDEETGERGDDSD
jgi:hypothetical protein